MNIAKKIELAELHIDRIVEHQDADSSVRLGAMQRLRDKIVVKVAALEAERADNVAAQLDGTPG